MCCIMFKESYDYKPRLPLINNYTISLNVDKDSMLNNNGSLKFEITAKRLYAASQRVL